MTDEASSPVRTSVELSESFLSCFGVKSVYILCDQPVQFAAHLPPLQDSVRTVGLVVGELRPADEVAGPVALPGLGAADKLRMLHGSSVGAGVQTHTLRAVVRDPGLCGQTRTADHKQASGPGHEVLQQLHRGAVSAAAGRDEGGCPPHRCCAQGPPW